MEYIKKRTLKNEDIENITQIRRKLHQCPELGFKEFETSKIIVESLKDIGYNIKEGIAKTGVLGFYNGKKNGKTLMLRADMDALSIKENNNLEFKSKNEGIMHACGHDGHMAILLETARQIFPIRDKIEGNIKFFFQPAEEGWNGAEVSIKDGILENPNVDNVVGLHLFSSIETGKISITYGNVMAGVDEFFLKIIGKGGHGAAPHETIDPIIIAANIINTSQTIVSRNIEPIDTAVVTFGSIHSGNFFNIIPDYAELSGTIRYFNNSTHNLIKNRFIQIIEGITKSFGADYELDYKQLNGATINEASITDIVKESAIEVVGKENIINWITMGGEDISSYFEKVPGCLFFVGSGNKEKGTMFPHHSSEYIMDEDALIIGTEVMVNFVKKYFEIK